MKKSLKEILDEIQIVEHKNEDGNTVEFRDDGISKVMWAIEDIFVAIRDNTFGQFGIGSNGDCCTKRDYDNKISPIINYLKKIEKITSEN
ncbi:hypothetical protein [Niallia sp. MER 6]|uniref:hypothetical protein n=1 Tax=Niallia sp. MER 6 TaxID=2939567 RepID=UPI0020417CD4|nr:hypothetical protein [Niallia sp. MER 6]MBY0155415.1 hypothetical protein [Cytobacillus firmus]MCM3032591.1 hypothetical protein [Niallia sp. MER 6]